MNELIVANAPAGPVALPDVLIGDRLDIEGERAATIFGYGPAHTESDLFVHLPDDGILIAGDLVWTGIHPKTDDGFPGEWAEVVDRLAGLGPASIVPGHGELGGPGDLDAMAAYLRAVEGMVEAVRAGDLDAEHADPPPGSADWQDVARFRKGLARLAARR